MENFRFILIRKMTFQTPKIISIPKASVRFLTLEQIVLELSISQICPNKTTKTLKEFIMHLFKR